MSIAALITQGIGPGGSVPYLLTSGLDIGADATPELGGTLIRRRGRVKWRQWIKDLEKQKAEDAERASLDQLRRDVTDVQNEIRLALSEADRDDRQLAVMERTLGLLNQVIEQAEENELETLLLTL